ncbi:putative sodium-coupled neutral amino acid transporter 7 [Vespa mandarinia]|uniref:putative sodium-coupled neutral amino acid transporter 7 n=1 Tax=Vespa mandarinia TaxID=7446 RepID=UPI00160A31F7|nr:putative sodium-coupled neutral amino acid transporter 7 [Vespa mandarinia]
MNCLTGETDRLINNDVFLSTAPSPSEIRTRETRTGSSIMGTIFLIVNATLGAGLLNFPQAFDKAGGIVTSITIQLGFLIFITAALIVLANCSDITNSTTIQNTLATLCGPSALFLCALCVAVYSFGCCLTFLIIIGDQLDRVLATYYGMDYCHTWYLSRQFVTAAISFVFIFPLCFFKRLDALSCASSVGCITVLYMVCLISYKNFTRTTATIVKIWPDNAYEALHIVPIICFAYQSHMTAIPMYACMKERQLGKFTITAVISMIICFTVYTIVGILGYATFGTGKVPSDILQGYSDKSIIVTIAVISIAIKNFTVYPIVLYCGRDAILSLFGTFVDENVKMRNFITFVWFIASLIIAILVPDISPVINLLGALSATFIFILPGICLLQSTLIKDPELYLNKDRLLILLAITITAIGAFVCGIVSIQALKDLKKPLAEQPLVTGFRIRLGENLCS